MQPFGEHVLFGATGRTLELVACWAPLLNAPPMISCGFDREPYRRPPGVVVDGVPLLIEKLQNGEDRRKGAFDADLGSLAGRPS